ncbi:MAG: HDOD domain-containing protein [Desulfarculus sp.]|nr:HDOD domain-containing protein [Desulfarculus sp.]
MRILVVDDDLASRKKMERIMGSFGQCQAVESGNAAMEAFLDALNQGQPFDLVTLDIIMPGKDGIETLLDLREVERALAGPGHKRATVFMVTSKSEKDSLITCVQAGCDDYIIKPFDREVVARKLTKFGLGQPESEPEPQALPAAEDDQKVDLGHEVLRQFQRGELNLPSPPTIYTKFHQLLEREASLEEIAELLKLDVAISFQIIGVSNSPYYRGAAENKTLEQALGRLGLEATKKYVDVLATRSLYAPAGAKYREQTQTLWRQALACAHASELLAQALGLTLSQDPFTLGLLHEIGKMILLHIVADLEKGNKLGGPVSPQDLQATLSAYQGQFGAAVLHKWGFPQEYVLVARQHDQPSQTLQPDLPELMVVRAAKTLAASPALWQDVWEQVRQRLEGLGPLLE